MERKLIWTSESADIEELRELYNKGIEEGDIDWFSDEAIYEYEGEIIWEQWKAIKKYNDFYDCVFLGGVGLWHGNYASAKYIETPEDMDVCGDYDIIRFYREGKRLFIELVHHDGSHYFEIVRLNSKGLERVANINNRYDDVEQEIIKDINKFKKNYTKCFFEKKDTEFRDYE